MHDNNHSQPSQHLSVTVEDNVLLIRLNRPKKLNALTQGTLVDLVQAIDSANKRSVVGLILTGTGRAFSAGHDLSPENQATDAQEAATETERFHEVSRALLRTSVPTIAILNGLAVGGGFEITLACDRRIGTSTSEVYMPENSLGLTISNAASYLLGRLIGQSAALDFILASRRVDATEALQLGLIDEIIDDNALATAIERIHQYNAAGTSTAQHLSLLRPSQQAIAEAMNQESAAAQAAWQVGTTQSGLNRFWESRH